MSVTIVVGAQFGDEGKGKIVSYLASASDMGMDKTKTLAVVRAGVGPNAGHTVVHEGVTYKLRLMPSGFFNKKAKIFIGAGVLISEEVFLKEIKDTGVEGRVFIDRQTGVITPAHVEEEKANNHLMGKIGSTGSGCGIAFAERINRKMKLAQEYDNLKPYCIDVSEELNDIIDDGGDVIIEGSQSTFLSLFHGTYPYVTSKDVSASATLSDVGIGPTRVTKVIAVCKAYVTRVGTGELVGELDPDEVVKNGWQEYGTVTGRLRRAAPFNFDQARKAVRINGATDLALTKMDILYPELKGAKSLDDLVKVPQAIEFIEKIEDYTGVPVTYISTGPEAEALIIRK